MSRNGAQFVQDAIFFAALFYLASFAWGQRRKLGFVLETYLRHPPHVYWRAIGLLIFTVTLSVIAQIYSPEVLQFSWVDAVLPKGGNLFVPVSSRQLTGHHPVTFFLIVGFYSVLLFSIPFICSIEERYFRAGAMRVSEIVPRSLLFGAVHFVVGVPIHLCLVLSFTGAWLAWRYRNVVLRESAKGASLPIATEIGLKASTIEHALYNATLGSLIFGFLLIGFFK